MNGLNESRRVDWRLPENRNCIKLANYGFSAECISIHTGLTVGQVGYRLKQKNIGLRDYRVGHGSRATVILNKFQVRSATG